MSDLEPPQTPRKELDGGRLVIACGGAGCRLLALAARSRSEAVHGVAIDAAGQNTLCRFDDLACIGTVTVPRCSDKNHRSGSRADADARRTLAPPLAGLLDTLTKTAAHHETPIAVWTGLGGYIGGHVAALISRALHTRGIAHTVQAIPPLPLEAEAAHHAANWQIQHLRRTANELRLLDTASIQAAPPGGQTIARMLARADDEFLAWAGFQN